MEIRAPIAPTDATDATDATDPLPRVLSAADEQAFGSRGDKLAGCKLQREAWDANTEYLTAVFTAVREPLPAARRLRGEVGTSFQKRNAAIIRKRDQMGTVQEEIDAKQAIEEASTAAIARATRAAMA